MPRPQPSRLAELPHLVEHEVAVDGIDPRHDGLRIVHLTDVHCGRMTGAEHVRVAVTLANRARADLVAMTGDYLNFRRDEIGLVRRQLAGLEAPRVVCTLGNHDYYASGDEVAGALASAGYDVLRNRHLTIDAAGAPLHVIGIDDPVTHQDDVAAAFDGLPPGGTRLALCHCPEKAGELAARGAHLVLSGHTHGGQINVRGITERLFRSAGKRYFGAGLYPVGGAWLYVSAGVGFSGVRVRAGRGTRAEVAVITLRAVDSLRSAPHGTLQA
ncbi:MAG TPA: metallophosphoesterase [Kofleriaceae bacterium]|nr:metallophosphoesterase [Kofleriaceae bacterium]